MISVHGQTSINVDEDDIMEALLRTYNPRQILVLLGNALTRRTNSHYEDDLKKISVFLKEKYADDRHLSILKERGLDV